MSRVSHRVMERAWDLHRRHGHPEGYDGPCWGPTQAEIAEARAGTLGSSVMDMPADQQMPYLRNLAGMCTHGGEGDRPCCAAVVLVQHREAEAVAALGGEENRDG